MKTSIGQVLDTQISKSFQLEKNFDRFTPEHYSTIVKYKTAYYSFQLPVTIAMYMVCKKVFEAKKGKCLSNRS